MPLEALRALLTIAGWVVLFYLCHKPAGKLLRIVLLVSFPACYAAWRLTIVTNSSTVNQINWVVIILLYALLCGNLKKPRSFAGPVFTAIYYIGMEACMDTLRAFIVRYSTGAGIVPFSPAYYIQINLLYLIVLGWAVFYYVVLKNRRGTLPLRFWIMTVLPPLGSMALLTYLADVARPLLDRGINIYFSAILTGLFLIALNLFTFYIYVRLLAFYESHVQAQVLQGQLTAYTRRITIIEAFQHQTDEIRHEFKNLLFTLNIDIEQQNYDRLKQRTAELLGDLKQAEPEHYTGISLIDAVISYKAVRLRELGTDLTVQAELLDMEAPGAAALPYDIASIMGIALDNVTDACELLNAKGRAAGAPVYCTRQKQKNLLLLIQVSNPLPGPLLYENGEIRSTKALSGHGLGLSALRRIVQKYGGKVTISDTGGTFSLTVTLFV
jgi:signal transduction histidine kinase